MLINPTEDPKVGLKMNMRKAKVMFINQMKGQQIMTGSPTHERALRNALLWNKQSMQNWPVEKKS